MCLIDSSIALARSSSSLETFTECSFDSFSERAITNARFLSSSSTGACSTPFSILGDELVGILCGDGIREGNEGGTTVSNGEG